MPYKDPARQREFQRRSNAERRAAWLAENGPCRDCGSWENLRVDHVDAALKTDHKVWSWSAERREAELAKCQVLCFPCHVLKTKENGESPRGERQWRAKLTEAQVLDIRSKAASGIRQKEIAQGYGIDKRLVSEIVLRKTWKHIK